MNTLQRLEFCAGTATPLSCFLTPLYLISTTVSDLGLYSLASLGYAAIPLIVTAPFAASVIFHSFRRTALALVAVLVSAVIFFVAHIFLSLYVLVWSPPVVTALFVIPQFVALVTALLAIVAHLASRRRSVSGSVGA